MNAHVEHHYNVVCTDSRGNTKWTEDFDNLVTTEGMNKYLDATLKTGLASPAWYVGLIDNAGFGAIAATDTAAKITNTTPNSPTTNDWAESEAYTEATRVAYTPGTISAGSVDNSTSKAAFSMNATKTINGCFLVSVNTKHGTTGTLLGVGSFGSTRGVNSGDTLNVTLTCSLS
jgi:hypothetical protein